MRVEIPYEHDYNEYLLYDINGKLIISGHFTGEYAYPNWHSGSCHLLLYSPKRNGYGMFVKD